jgi:5-formyltetrahydrofolate cyclo-ligase
MDAYLIENMDHIRRGKFGIWEPDMTRAALVGPEDLAVVLVPGLIFSEPNGARLGRGGGYFDRYLARTPKTTLRVGVALDWQVVSNLPTEPHDQCMNWLVTDKRVIRCSSD